MDKQYDMSSFIKMNFVLPISIDSMLLAPQFIYHFKMSMSFNSRQTSEIILQYNLTVSNFRWRHRI